MVLLDPRGRQRWKECAVQPVNTLTQRGKKTSDKQLSHHPKPPLIPPPAIYTWSEGGRESGGGVKQMEEEGNENTNCREMEKVLNGKKKG